jgi:type II secretory pathway predicted ATPase ExeA
VDHLRHFGLSEDPFRDELRVRDFCETGVARDARLRVERGLRQGRGLGIVSGEPGSGKSMLLRRILDGLEDEVFEASMLVVLPGAGDAGALLARFARHLGVDEPAAERQALLGQIFERLAIAREEGRQAVLLVDDADVLGGSRALAELVGLLRLEYEDRRLLSLVLAGASGLDHALGSDGALSHRADFRVTLGSLDPQGTDAYLAHRIENAGGDPAILAPDAIEAMHQLGRGLPGLLNRLADNALFEAFLCGRGRATRADVERAHRDLGFDALAKPPARALPDEAPAFGSGGRTGEAEHRDAASAGPQPVELAPFSADDASLGDLDAELEAIFETADASASPAPRHPRTERGEPLVARFLED